MLCTKCNQPLPEQAKFCPNCAAPAPNQPTIQVQQEVGTVKGEVVGTILGKGVTTPGISASTTQKIESVETGGAAVGTIFGDKESHIHVGGEQHYGKIVQDDHIEVGDITDSQGIAIGRGAKATVTTGISDKDLVTVFAPLWHVLQQTSPDKQAEAMQKAKELQTEAAKSNGADDTHLATLVDELVKLVPDALSAVVSIFTTPILAGIAGPVTKFVLARIQSKQQ